MYESSKSSADQPTRSTSGSPTPPPLPSTNKSKLDQVQAPHQAKRARAAVLVWYSTASAVVVVLIGLALHLFLTENSTKKQPAKDQASANKRSAETSAAVESDSNRVKPAKVADNGTRPKMPRDQIEIQRKPEPVAQADPQGDEAPAIEQPFVADVPKPKVDDLIPEVPINQNPLDANAADATDDVDRMIVLASDLMQNIAKKSEKDAMAAFKQAYVTLRKASNVNPKDIRPDFYAGLLHSGVGINDPKTAELHFRRVLERQPGHVATMNNLALVEIRARRMAIVKNYFGLVSKVDRKPIEFGQNLGRLLANSDLLALKGDDLKKFTALKEPSNGFASSVGWVYMPLDRKAPSLKEYKPFCRDGRLEDPRCLACSGHMSLVCRLCNGSGTQLQTGVMAQTIVGLYGTVTVTNPVSGQSACQGCGGRGRVDCRYCQNGRDATIMTETGDPYQRLFGDRLPDPN